jgi:aryl-alcohol dehydrogenase-like predicted oxidoreductase
MKNSLIPQRRYRNDIQLSILGLGGMLFVGMPQQNADKLVSESIEKGINYFDVAPFYGDGEAERKMGSAIAGRRKDLFLACKTLERSAGGAGRELEHSLRCLHTDYFDLYQFHAVSSIDEVEEIFGIGGAMEAFLRARDQGKIRFIGFSAHSVEAALAMFDHFPFDSVLFPVNFINYARGNFGPQVIAKAKELGVACLAIKALAHGPWRKKEEHKYPNCWYRPIDERVLARQALRFTLSENVTALIPPGDEGLFRMALELATDLPPLTPQERSELLATTRSMRPLMRAV